MFFTLVLTVESCKKDEPKSKIEILTSRSWIVSSGTTNGVEKFLDDCVKDNYFTFATNGTYTLHTGAIKCVPSEIDYTNTWSLSDDGKTILLGQTQWFIEITESKLVLTVVDGNDTLVMILLAM